LLVVLAFAQPAAFSYRNRAPQPSGVSQGPDQSTGRQVTGAIRAPPRDDRQERGAVVHLMQYALLYLPGVGIMLG